MPHPAIPHLRYKLTMSAEKSAMLEEYLSRTTLFWNLLIQYLKEPMDAYMAEPATPESRAKLYQEAEKFFYCLKTCNHSECVSSTWLPFMPKIMELPVDILHSRLVDLVEACVLADRTEGDPQGSGIPRRKTAKSSQSVRFSPGQYEIKGDRLVIHSTFPFELEIPPKEDALAELNQLPSQYSLAITRRRIAEQPHDGLGPVEDLDRDYVITLKPLDDQSADS